MSSSAQYISVREAAQLLGTTERKIIDLIESKELNAYRIANQFLRLKKSEVSTLRKSGNVESETTHYGYTIRERINDFFYYNDFYIFSLFLILILVYIILYL